MTNAELQKKVAELEAQNKALNITVTNLLKEIDRLKDLGLEPIDPSLSAEEQILIKQINYFMAESQTRQLSLDETRALDLLLKNKRIIDDKKPKTPDDEVPEGTSTADLLRLVSNGEPTAEKTKTKRNKPKTGD